MKKKKTPATSGKKRIKAGTSKAEAAKPVEPEVEAIQSFGATIKLTPQQEKFAQLTALGMNQSAAYRVSYNAKRMKEKTVHEEASRLAADPKVSARVAEIRAPVIAEVRYGLKEAMEEAEDAMHLASQLGQAGAAVAAVQLRAKLNGLGVEDRKNERRPFEDMTTDELERANAEADRAIARARGEGVSDKKGASKAARAKQD